jgi:TonB-dependent receptor
LSYKAPCGGRRARLVLLSATILAGNLSTAAFAQTAAAPAAGAAPASDAPVSSSGGQPAVQPSSTEAPAPVGVGGTVKEVVVTGFRRSLTDEANAKRLAPNFTDSVFAEDIGKFPDQNIAESLQRIPGVQLTRDVDGEGTQISVRGLGPSFVKILLNGSQIAVASDGTLDSGSSNREVDLDLFPTEFFTKLTVAKTPTADLVEGGISGTVNMVNIHPFDNPGEHVNFSFQEGYGQADNRASPHGSLIASDTFDGDKFGILVGVAGGSLQYRSTGYETIGYTTPTINCAGCNVIDGMTGSGKGFNFANANAPQTAGLSPQALSNALFPRLARDAFIQGSRDRVSTILSTEWRPMDNLHFTFDGLYSHAERDFNRLDEDLSLRNSTTTIPSNVQVDANGVVTQATLQNAQLFLEARPYKETVDFYNLNPQFDYKPLDWVQVDGQVNYNKSTFYRSDDSFLFNTPGNETVNYSNAPGSAFPTINVSQPLNNPNLGYTINSFRVQPVKRVTEDTGAHFNVTFGDAETNIKMGYAYDDTYREITAFDNSTNANNFATANISNAQIPGLLAPGPSGILGLSGMNPGNLANIIAPNYAALRAAANTNAFDTNPPFATSSATSTPSGTIDEKTSGAYIEANGVSDFFQRKIHWNAGVRYFSTDQTIIGPVTLNGATSFQTFNTHYDGFLPSFNASIDLADHWLMGSDHLILRLAGSRSVTRANPDSLLPGTTFSDPSAQTATQGNPTLKPYFSNNADLGLEYYFMGSGYLSLDLFAKDIDGFTQQSIVNEPFSALGIPLSSLNVTQLATGVNANTIISVQTTSNIGQTLSLRGEELSYSQPLDFVTRLLPFSPTGFGFTGNYTHVEQSSANPNAIVLGIANNLYTFTGYYEKYGFSLHVSYNYIGQNQTAPTGQNNTPFGLFANAHGQVDMAASYTLPWYNKAMQITFNAVNLNNEPLRTFFGFTNAPYSVYYPGSSYEIGIRAKF